LVTIVGAISDVLGLLVALVGWVIIAGYGIYIGYLNGLGGSPGKRLTGLKVVSENDGQVIGGGMGIVRWLAHILDGVACGLGYLWPIWDDKRQTFSDKVVRTYVLCDQPKQPFGPDILKP
jgi:uncharacterized RDD family membrane protein YckC